MQEKKTKKAKQPVRASRKLVAAIVSAVLALGVLAAVVVALFANAVVFPPGAAAKYNMLSYLSEDQVTEYINTYRTMSGYTSDEAWAQELSDEGYEPSTFRLKTIRQLVIDALVAEKASSLNIAVSESDVDSYIQSMKDSIGFGDDSLFEQTLAMYGRTEEDMRNLYIKELARQAVFEAEVPVPEPTDEEVANYVSVQYATGLTTKHSYCIKMEGDASEESYEKLGEAQKVREGLLKDGLNSTTFASYVDAYCVDDDLKERGGANGWDLDSSSLSSAYLEIMEDMKVGDLSEVFSDGDNYYIVWVDDSYTLPDLSDVDTGTMSVDSYLKDMPETLKSYFTDCTAKTLWQADCDEYLVNLYNNANPQVAPMPSGLSYDVDMSLAESSTDEEGDADTNAADTSNTNANANAGTENAASKEGAK